jgi:hypothetical protein
MNGKKTRKIVTRRTYKKGGKRKTLFSAKASGVLNYQVLNRINKYYHFADSYDPDFSIIAGTGNPIAQLSKFKISQIGRYSALVSMFRQVRVDSITYRFSLLTVEQTDNATLPTMYVRYNYNPDLITGALGEDQMEKLSNVVKKTFSHNTPQARSFNYRIKPAVMGAMQLYATSNFVPSPLYNKFVDLDPGATTDEIEFYGLQLFIPVLAVGMQIQCTAEVRYTCRDLV